MINYWHTVGFVSTGLNKQNRKKEEEFHLNICSFSKAFIVLYYMEKKFKILQFFCDKNTII